MRAQLSQIPVVEPSWPERVRLRSYRDGDGPRVHALLAHAYRHGGGAVAPLDEWLRTIPTDEEFEPELVLLAEADGELVGVALCWTSAFVKDLAVHESWRGRGLGEALLRHVLAVFRARGAPHVDLKVEANNPSGAQRLYARVGMRVVERLKLP